MEQNFEIKLPVFKGPFDLLLFFIERDELDIHNIPIASITNDFLDYIHQLEELNIEVASEFILVAATLMHIKARMLLPRPEIDEQGNEIDPREELVSRLLEYKAFKDASEKFRNFELLRSQMEKRGNINSELVELSKLSNIETDLQDLDLYKLMRVFEKVMTRFEERKNPVIHTVTPFPYTIEEQKGKILNMLQPNTKLSFEKIMLDSKDRVELIYNFISILELLQDHLIDIHIGEGYNNFWVEEVGDSV